MNSPVMDPETVLPSLSKARQLIVPSWRLWIGVPEGNRASGEILTAYGFSGLPSSLRMCYGECSVMGNPRGRFSIGAPDKG